MPVISRIESKGGGWAGGVGEPEAGGKPKVG